MCIRDSLYFVPVIGLCITKFHLILVCPVTIMGRLTKYLTFTLMLYVYVVTYKYNFVNKNYYRFVEDFFRKENYLQKFFKNIAKKEIKQQNFKAVFLFLTNFIPMLYVINKFYQYYHISMFLATFRRLIALEVDLQWSLCMHILAIQITKLRYIMKNVFVVEDLDASLSTYMLNDTDMTNTTAISLSKLNSCLLYTSRCV